jgi:hypothetical protein
VEHSASLVHVAEHWCVVGLHTGVAPWQVAAQPLIASWSSDASLGMVPVSDGASGALSKLLPASMVLSNVPPPEASKSDASAPPPPLGSNFSKSRPHAAVSEARTSHGVGRTHVIVALTGCRALQSTPAIRRR